VFAGSGRLLAGLQMRSAGGGNGDDIQPGMSQKRLVILIGRAVVGLGDPIRIGFAALIYTRQVSAFHGFNRAGMKISNHPAANNTETKTAFFCHGLLLIGLDRPG
jgi:hypothetical protein